MLRNVLRKKARVLAKWYAAMVVRLLHEEPEPTEWKESRVWVERGVNYGHMQALLTNILQRHWVWHQDRRGAWVPGFFKCQTAFMASLDVKTPFDVAKPSVVSRKLTYVGTRGHVVEALLEEMKDVRGSACSENCDTGFRH